MKKKNKTIRYKNKGDRTGSHAEVLMVSQDKKRAAGSAALVSGGYKTSIRQTPTELSRLCGLIEIPSRRTVSPFSIETNGNIQRAES